MPGFQRGQKGVIGKQFKISRQLTIHEEIKKFGASQKACPDKYRNGELTPQ